MSTGAPPEGAPVSGGALDADAVLGAEDEVRVLSAADVCVPLLDKERALGVYTVRMPPEDEGDREAAVLEISVDDILMIATVLQLARK